MDAFVGLSPLILPMIMLVSVALFAIGHTSNNWICIACGKIGILITMLLSIYCTQRLEVLLQLPA